MDYNKQTPNTEDGDYSFYIDTSVPIEAPTADFTYTVEDNTVYFTDASQNNPTSWHWDFGDGSTSTQQNIMHTYATSGSYNVTLTVSNQYGSDNITKTIYVSTPNSITISGTVEDNNWNPIPYATVSADNGGGQTTTDNNGDFSIEVPYNWSGTVTASAPGYQSAQISYDNLIEDVTNAYFMLHPMTDFNFTWTSSGLNAQFTPHGINPNCDCFWDFGDGDTELVATSIGNTLHSYLIENTYYVCLQQVCDGVYSEPYCDNVYISTPPLPPSAENCPVDFYLPCNIIEKGTTIYLYDISPFKCSCFKGEDTYFKLFKQWMFIDNNGIYYTTPRHHITSNNPYYSISHTFNFGTTHYIRLNFGYFEKQQDGSWWPYPAHVDTKQKTLKVFDCNITGVPIHNPLFYGPDYTFSNQIAANNHHLYAGSFHFDGRMNEYLNSGDLELDACNEIIIDGDNPFYATGEHELVLNNFNSTCVNNEISHIQNAYYTSQNTSYYSLKNFKNQNNIKCYPNPFTSYINLSIIVNKNDNYKITLYDIYGRKIKDLTNENLKEGIHSINYNLSPLQTGIYLLQIQTSQGINTIKIEKAL